MGNGLSIGELKRSQFQDALESGIHQFRLEVSSKEPLIAATLVLTVISSPLLLWSPRLRYKSSKAFCPSSVRESRLVVSGGRVHSLGSMRSLGSWFAEEYRLLLLPSSAERLVELDQCDQFIALRLSEPQFCSEGVGLVGKYFQIVGRSCFEPHLREPGTILR